MTKHSVAKALAPVKNLTGSLFRKRQTSTGKTGDREEDNFAELARVLASGSPVCLITSFPRSGNTWVRYLLSDIFHQCSGIKTTTALPVHPDKIIPDVYAHVITERDPSIKTPGLFVKTHEGFDKLKKRVAHPAFEKCRHVYIFRSPEDSFVSFYRLHLREEHLKQKAAAVGIDAFCRSHFPDWAANVSSYVKAAQNGAKVYFVSYELLLKEPIPVFSGILRWLGIEHQTEMVERAVTNMRIDNLHAVESQKPGNIGEFSGRGKAGSAAGELLPATLAEIQKKTAALLREANAFITAQKIL